jgi:hypothetical protein
MRDWRDEPRRRHELVTIPVIWLAIILSLLVHTGALFIWITRPPIVASEGAEQGEASTPLQLQLVPRATPPAPE